MISDLETKLIFLYPWYLRLTTVILSERGYAVTEGSASYTR
jgi:hypothetical protein